MDRIYFNKIFHRSCSAVCVYGKGDSVPIDQQAVKPFNINPETGRPMSDMTAILRSQGLDQQRLLAELTEFKSSFLPDDVSDVDALKYMQPRLCQLPSELAEYSEKVSKARLEEVRSKKSAQEIEEFRKKLLDISDDDKDKYVDDDKE